MNKVAWEPFRRTTRRLARRIGRRGASLLFIGGLSAAQAFSVISLPPETLNSPTYQVLTSIFPLSVWAVLWSLSALLSFIQAPMLVDRIAYSVSAAVVALWGASYIFGWLQGLNARGWVGGAIFVAFAGWITIISAWPESIDMRRMTDTNAAVVTADRDGTITTFNPAAEALFGWNAQQIIGHDLTTLMPERFRAAHEDGMSRVTSTGHSSLAGQVIALTALHRDGTEFPIELTITMWPTPAGPTYTGVIRSPAQVT